MLRNKLAAMMLLLALLNAGCGVDEPEAPAIFNGVDLMRATKSVNTITFYDVPSEVTVLVVGIFDGPEITVDANNVITNTNWAGGNRTGLSGIDRNSTTQYWQFNPATRDFIEGSPAATISAGDSWAVWGYNADWIIICSTSKYTW